MILASFKGNDCLVGIKNGKLFITGMNKCCHGNAVDQITIWLPVELIEKLSDIKNYDEAEQKSRFNFN